jgi:predicted dinucleotide-binding enzyme
MTYAIIGFGSIGQALATTFARRGIEVMVASRRPAEELAPQADAIGPTVVPTGLAKALEADIVFLAVPFAQHAAVAKARKDWRGKVMVDVTNAFGVPAQDLDGLPSSAFVGRGLPGARLIKGFNHLAAKVLGSDPAVNGGRRVVFLSSDEEEMAVPVKALAEQLGFAPVWLGKLAEGGALVQARNKNWGELIFQDFVKFDGK